MTSGYMWMEQVDENDVPTGWIAIRQPNGEGAIVRYDQLEDIARCLVQEAQNGTKVEKARAKALVRVVITAKKMDANRQREYIASLMVGVATACRA